MWLTCQQNIAPISQPYISAVASNCVTISGPPTSLEHLLNSNQFSNLKAAHTSVYAAYHADHIYTLNDVDMILSNKSLTPVRSCTDAIPIFSNSTGKMHSVTEHRALIHTILSEILTEPIRWDRIVDGISADVMASHTSVCEILSFGGNATQSLVSGLARDSGPVVEAKEDVWCQQIQANSDRASGRRDQSKIAIIGFSGRYPDAASNEKFWEILHNGRDVHRPIPTDRFDAAAHMDPTGKKRNTSRIGHGCFIEDPGLFDERFFNMSPREAANCDPGQRLAIVTAYEAQEMAGFVTGRTPSTQKDRVGIFYGMTSDDWREVNSGQNIDTYFIPGGNRAFTPGRLNYFFKFSGPSFSVDTACSSSFAAIHAACNSLWQGDCDTAFAGGTNVMTNPDNFAGLDRGHFLSTKGNCNTFDDNADGYCRADGVGTVILKRLEDAEADGDPIQGVLLGAYTNHSADAVSMTRPDAGAQAFIFEQMLNSCNVSPQDISYIEMHGTGTQAGDWTEMRSVLQVFAPAAGKRPNQPLYLGSTKSNIGHAESSSGVLSLIKVLLMMRNNEIPPHCGIKTKINQKFPTDLAERNVHIATKPTDWSRPDGGLRRVFLNNFSAAGGNTALLLEDSPPSTAPALASDPRNTHVVTISGKSPAALEKNTRALLEFIAESPAISLPALSYTTTARRIHHSYRTAVCGADLRSISGKLADALAGEVPRAIPAKAGKVAFVFTGQGVLQLEMGKRLFETISQFRSDIVNFDQIAQRQGFPSFRGLIDGSLRDQAAISPVVAQLGTTCLQIALFRLWMSWGIQPSVVVGHSLGEYAAFHAAGILSVTDTIYLTGARAQLMIERCTVGTHCMLAVMISIEELKSKWSSMSYEVACVNGPTEVVLSGTIDSMHRLAASLAEGHIKSTKLAVPFAFHSSQVDPILDDFGDLAQSVEFNKPIIPYMSPLLKDVVTDANILGAQYLQKACRGTVDFLSVINAAKSSGVVTDKTAWIEVGSHPICSNMLKQICGTTITALPSMKRGEDCLTTLAFSVARLYSFGLTIDWNHYHHDFRSSQTVLRLPTYCWDARKHWIQYNNDFCLTKGEPVAEEVAVSALPLSILTPSVQHIIEQKFEGQRPMVVMQSDLAEPKLAKVIQSHKVNGVALCPSVSGQTHQSIHNLLTLPSLSMQT
jgi:naphtho-gamma-pyrone polyketide synthase